MKTIGWALGTVDGTPTEEFLFPTEEQARYAAEVLYALDDPEIAQGAEFTWFGIANPDWFSRSIGLDLLGWRKDDQFVTVPDEPDELYYYIRAVYGFENVDEFVTSYTS